MAYRVRWEAIAYKKLIRFDSKHAVKILDDLNKLSENPYGEGKALDGKLKGKYRLQVGDYRVIYTIK